jgi:hypothetical protein
MSNSLSRPPGRGALDRGASHHAIRPACIAEWVLRMSQIRTLGWLRDFDSIGSGVPLRNHKGKTVERTNPNQSSTMRLERGRQLEAVLLLVEQYNEKLGLSRTELIRGPSSRAARAAVPFLFANCTSGSAAANVQSWSRLLAARTDHELSPALI